MSEVMEKKEQLTTAPETEVQPVQEAKPSLGQKWKNLPEKAPPDRPVAGGAGDPGGAGRHFVEGLWQQERRRKGRGHDGGGPVRLHHLHRGGQRHDPGQEQ